MKVAVIIYAHFLTPDVWEKVMWGDPLSGSFGVIPYGLQLAHKENASLIYLCSGIPKNGGRSISPDALLSIQLHLRDISEISARIIQNTEAQNTREELEGAALFMQQEHFER